MKVLAYVILFFFLAQAKELETLILECKSSENKVRFFYFSVYICFPLTHFLISSFTFFSFSFSLSL